MGGLGSLGVFLLNLKDNAGVITLKQGAASSAAEFFASLLYAKLGIATPAMRVLDKSELAKVVEQLGDVAFTSPGAGDHLQSGGGQRGGVLMDFSPGVTLKHPQVAEMFTDKGTSKSILTQLGRIVAVDMFINNFDRTPCVWAHEGNANNVMFSSDNLGAVTVMAIDQGP